MYTRRPGSPSGEDTIGARRARATRVSHEPGVIAKAATVLVPPAPFPRIEATLSILRTKKQPLEDPDQIPEAKDKMSKSDRQSQPSEKLRVAEVERHFDPENIGTILMRAGTQNGPGLRALRYGHLQAAIPVSLSEEIVAFTKRVSTTIPYLTFF